jgi:type I restriction enzyme, S subunit
MQQGRYPLRRVGHVTEVQLGKMLQAAPASTSDIEVRYLRAGHLSAVPAELPTMWASPLEVLRYAVKEGDLVVAEGGDVGRPEFVPRSAAGAIIQNSLHRVRPRDGGDRRYVRYALLAVHGSDWLDVFCNRSTFGHLTVDKLSTLRIPMPAPDTQRAIADFLDTETARIDALITKKRRMIDLLEEKRLAHWAHLTLPSRELPKGWEWRRVRHLCPEVTVGVVVDPSSYFAPEGVPFIHGTDVRRGWIDETNLKYLSAADNGALMKSQVRAGDVLAMRVGEPGRAAVVPPHLDGSNCASVLIFRRSERLTSELLAVFLNSNVGRSQIEAMQYGAAQGVLNVSHARELRVPVPPVEAQRSMTTELRRLNGSHDRLRQRLTTQIALLQEHRQALITAAVTGEPAVSGVAA